MRDPEEDAAMDAEVTRLQGTRCVVPSCTEPWVDKAHIEPSGMGERPSTWRIGNLAGLCRHHHQVYDGQVLQGRQQLMRELMLFVVRQVRQNRALLATQEPTMRHAEEPR